MGRFRHTEGLGQQVREAREAAGLTQSELAERAAMSQQQVSLIERAAVQPMIDTLQRLAVALRADWSYDGVRIVFARRRSGRAES